MHKTRYFLFSVALLAMIAPRLRADDQEANASKERELIAVLQSDAAKAEKALTCKGLAVYGTAAAVPALASLLTDPELTSWARIALEAIPDPAADAALREAMGKVQGRTLIGVINSLGVRHDAAAVGALAERLQDADAEVASAAAAALGCIGNAEATQALQQALTTAPGARSAVAEGCIFCAEKLLTEGKMAEAEQLYEQVRKADVPKQRMLEATRGVILARQSDGAPLLIELLQSEDKGLFGLGLSTARELAGADVTESLVGALEKVWPERRALVILALADRGDAAVLPTMMEAAQSGSMQVRIAAVGALGRMGDASSLPILLSAATETDEELSQAGKAALEALPGDGVNKDIADLLGQATGKQRLVLIEVAGGRRIPAVPLLLKAAEDTDAQVRSAALTALGEVVELNDLSALIERVVAPRNTEDAEVVQRALRAASVRMPDREACAEKLAAAMSGASLPARKSLLEVLAAVGGAKALQAIDVAAKENNPELQDIASELLGKWMTPDAAPVLLDLAKSNVDDKYKIRALRGCIAILRRFDMPEQERAEMCRAALAAAQRDAERKLVLEVCGIHPSVDTLKLAIESAKVPALKNDAVAAALAIAEKMGGSEEVHKMLSQIGYDPVKIEIVKAEYGAGATFKDVTAMVQGFVGDFPLIILKSNSYNTTFGGDPAPNTVKQLKIQYKIDGKAGEVTFPENATVLLPIPK